MSKPCTSHWPVAIGLVALVAWSIGLTWLSGSFSYENDVLDNPVYLFVALQVAAGVIYLLTLLALRHRHATRGLLMAIIAAGVIMRIAQFGAVPVLEDDYYRYLWDGAVTANAQSPYAYSPAEVLEQSDGVPGGLMQLADESCMVLERINHPWLKTIYPPTTQAAFAMAYWISPFNILGLRIVWLGLDLMILGLLLVLLRGRSSICFALAIYWLNPLLIKEVFNAGHMELVLVVSLLAVLATLKRGMHQSGGLLLGLAVGAKLWPMLWLPLYMRHDWTSWRRGIGMLLAFAIPAVVLLLPIALGRLDPGSNSGFAAYARYWQMNDSAYLLVHKLAKLVSHEHAHMIARLVVMSLLLGVMAFCVRKFRRDFDGLVSGVMVITGALFLLSPTQFPWYFLWVLPLLPLRPMWSLLALTVTLPLYYLRFSLDAMGHAVWFDYGIIWIEFVPIWLLLIWELRRASRSPANRSNQETTSCITPSTSL